MKYKLLYWTALVIPLAIAVFAAEAIAEISAILLVALFVSPVLIGGLIAIVTKHAYLRPSRLKKAIPLQGEEAVRFGWMLIILYAIIMTIIGMILRP